MEFTRRRACRRRRAWCDWRWLTIPPAARHRIRGWQTLIRDYTGHTEYRDDLGVLFGVGSIDGSMASAVFGGLHFEILE